MAPGANVPPSSRPISNTQGGIVKMPRKPRNIHLGFPSESSVEGWEHFIGLKNVHGVVPEVVALCAHITRQAYIAGYEQGAEDVKTGRYMI